jgi:hypothetical protein
MPLRRITSAAVFLLAVTSSNAAAQMATTAFLKSEVTTGMTKQCIYDALGNLHTRTLRSIDFCPLSIQVVSPPNRTTQPPAPPAMPSPATITAFKKGEVTSGMTKQCIYESLGSMYTRTMNAIDLCPLSIRVRQR